MAEEKTYNKITVVDEHDNVIGAEMLFDALEQGLLRSGVRMFVFSDSGKVLLQRRSAHVRHPLELGMSADGHVDEGEERLEAAYRELSEETGIKGYDLAVVEQSFVSPGSINGVYKATVPDDIPLELDESEVAELRWVSVEELDSLVQYQTAACTAALVDTWKQLRNKLITA